jgi:hypothetical protein
MRRVRKMPGTGAGRGVSSLLAMRAASSRPAVAGRVARIGATGVASALTLTLGVGLAYVAGEAAADVARVPTAPSLPAAHVAMAAPAEPPGPTFLANLVVLAPRALAGDTGALQRLLQPASWRASSAFQASAPYQASASATGSDVDCLTAAVYYEARGEPQAGQEAVAQVVLNRVRNPAFPKSVCGVVYQGVGTRTCQFSFACTDVMRRPLEAQAWDRARTVAQHALSGYVMPTVGRAVSYHTIALGNLWAGTMVEVARVGQHVFYGFLGHASDPVADAPPAVAPPLAANATEPAPASNAAAPSPAQQTVATQPAASPSAAAPPAQAPSPPAA